MGILVKVRHCCQGCGGLWFAAHVGSSPEDLAHAVAVMVVVL